MTTTDAATDADKAAEIAAAEEALQAAKAEVVRLRVKLSDELAEAKAVNAAEEGRAEARRRHLGKESATSAAVVHNPGGTTAGVHDDRSSTAADGIAAARSRAGKR